MGVLLLSLRGTALGIVLVPGSIAVLRIVLIAISAAVLRIVLVAASVAVLCVVLVAISVAILGVVLVAISVPILRILLVAASIAVLRIVLLALSLLRALPAGFTLPALLGIPFRLTARAILTAALLRARRFAPVALLRCAALSLSLGPALRWLRLLLLTALGRTRFRPSFGLGCCDGGAGQEGGRADHEFCLDHHLLLGCPRPLWTDGRRTYLSNANRPNEVNV